MMNSARLRRGVMFGAALTLSLAVGCSRAAEPDPQIAADMEAGVARLEATRLEGPFAGISEFCQLLGAASCEARAGAISMESVGDDELSTRGGATVRLVPVATRDAAGHERIWMLFERGASVWALAPLVEYDPQGGVVPTVSVEQLAHEADFADDLVQVSWQIAFERDGMLEQHAATEVCSVPADEALACAQFSAPPAQRVIGGPIPIEAPGITLSIDGDLVEVHESTGRGDAEVRRYRFVRP